MKNLLVVLSLILSMGAFAQKKSLPHLNKENGKTSLIVDGKPFLMFAGELHNSSTGSAYQMRPIWEHLKGKNLNTVLAPVSWEMIEPGEGDFNFSVVDSMIAGARKENLKLIILWFGSWKNGKSTYVPGWVKKDQERFPLMKTKSGRTLNTLSPFNDNALKADKKAFSELMKHIKKVDGKEHTVIMMQVQNEVGVLGPPRDYSELANEAFQGDVPQELLDYLDKNSDKLHPALKKAWEKNGFKKQGSWEEVFGKGEKYRGEEWKTNYGFYTEELFMAWHIAKYIGEVSYSGRDEYNLPMFANAWIKQPRATNPGRYPSGGPLPHVVDVWRAAAPSIDFLASDIYAVEEFDWVCQEYALAGNPTFIPETTPDVGGYASVLYAFGKYDALCYAPFGIDGNGLFNTADQQDQTLTKVYQCLQNIQPYIHENRGTEKMTGLFLDKEDSNTSVVMGDYTIYLSRFSSAGLFEKTGGRFGIEGEKDRTPAGVIVIQLAKDEFLIAGGVGGLQVALNVSEANDSYSCNYLSVDELFFAENGEIHPHRLNGDEIALGGPIIRPGEVKVFKIKMYSY